MTRLRTCADCGAPIDKGPNGSRRRCRACFRKRKLTWLLEILIKDGMDVNREVLGRLMGAVAVAPDRVARAAAEDELQDYLARAWDADGWPVDTRAPAGE